MENFESLMILAGGKGTRFKEYTEDIPKPMIRALNKPLLIHIIDHYINYQVKKIVILAGYKKEVISEFFI
jgi:glucose-1-phosphate cytidylyltransferase